jgi:hypothetical protein
VPWWGINKLRIKGFIQHSSEARAPDFYVKLKGQWKSDAYLHYLRVSLEQRWALLVLVDNAALSRVG